jgi:hypothetical protein
MVPMSSPAEEVATVLEDAADYIDVHGWCQRRAVDVSGRVCLVGAITRAAIAGQGQRSFGVSGPAMGAVAAYLALHRDFWRGVEWLPPWNDTRGRTQDEVTDTLRRAAKEVRNGDIIPG